MLLLSLLVLSPDAAPADPAPPRDWAATLRTDAQAMHDDIAANHPGPVNTLDPDFSKRNDAGLALAVAVPLGALNDWMMTVCATPLESRITLGPLG